VELLIAGAVNLFAGQTCEFILSLD